MEAVVRSYCIAFADNVEKHCSALDLVCRFFQCASLMIKPETKSLHEELEKRAGYLWRYL